MSWGGSSGTHEGKWPLGPFGAERQKRVGGLGQCRGRADTRRADPLGVGRRGRGATAGGVTCFN